MSFACPLCFSAGPFEIWLNRAWKAPRFRHCPGCDAVFVPPGEQVTLAEEKTRYETHENDLAAPGFRDFLMRTVEPIRRRLPAGARILDFGSGPEPSLSKLLAEAGFEVVSFDPFFNPVPVEGRFDLVLAHEVFEHLREPRRELERIRDWLKPGGTFVIRSELCPDRDVFTNWWYARDFTHIFFASERTLQVIAGVFHAGTSFEVWSPNHWAFITH